MEALWLMLKIQHRAESVNADTVITDRRRASLRPKEQDKS
jgi:hypothetical protein